MKSLLTQLEIDELIDAFSKSINYESDDPFAPIDPLKYVSSDGDTCLHIAAHRGNLRAVELLIRAGLDVNQPGDMGYTPLQYASTGEIVVFLLTNGADPTIKNEFGKSPIGWSDH